MYNEDNDFAKQLAREKFRHAVLAPQKSKDGDRRDSIENSNSKKSRIEWNDISDQSFTTPRFEAPFPLEVPNYPPPILHQQGAWPPTGEIPPINQPIIRSVQSLPIPSKFDNETLTQPTMLSQRQFISTLSDRVSDSEAKRKYDDYKTEFKRQQIYDFFQQHKHEEWFRVKYHPSEEGQRMGEAQTVLKRRCHVFLELMKLGRLDSVSLDAADSKALIKLLDAAVILMEGGNSLDLKVLEDDYKPFRLNSVDSNYEIMKQKTRGGRGYDKDHDKVSRSYSEFDEASVSDSDNENESANHNTPSSTVLEGNIPYGAKIIGEERQPLPLHKTSSLFLRTLAPATTKQEVEMLCSRFPGFKRVALQDPQPEQGFLRRAWVTFSHNVNVRDICWNLSNAKIRDQDIGAIVNSELKQRVRAVTGLTVHRSIAKQDIKNAFKMIQNLDHKYNIWNDDGEQKDENNIEFCGFISKNPVLHNITDYLVDEGSYEEEALLQFQGSSHGAWDEDMDLKSKPGHAEVMLEKDKSLLKALDKMLLYLRIVYSIDYYNAIEYSKEDEMPHRCGIIHARSPPPQNRITNNDINEWTSSFEKRIAPMLKLKTNLNTDEMKKLGRKDTAIEVEKFIMGNTQELGKDKWFCPLSGKKFKGPDFVRKHILTKHMDKVEEVKFEAIYFNNYLQDSNRPQLPEHPPVVIAEASKPPTLPSTPTTPNLTPKVETLPEPPRVNYPPPIRDSYTPNAPNAPREPFSPREGFLPAPPRNYIAPSHLKIPYTPPREGYLPPPHLREPYRPPHTFPPQLGPREQFRPPLREPFSPPNTREPFRPMSQPPIQREAFNPSNLPRDPFYPPQRPPFMMPGGQIREPNIIPSRDRFIGPPREQFRGMAPLQRFPVNHAPSLQVQSQNQSQEKAADLPDNDARLSNSNNANIRHPSESYNARFGLLAYPVRPNEGFRPRMRFVGNGKR